ncbi:uncharacterized protein LOC127698810 [Mytilus californianus]|uniref:uncharacterized protein LOC127698810 n=1 Tax=Mytilus californianus TaxID=6549 RepID=UPI002245947E|nr:uncharacterized protein LOC127698810 [Mytilus californianus]
MERCNSQVKISCQLCDGSQNLKWRCIDCRITICDSCSGIHSRIPSTKEHMIVKFGDISTCNMELRLEEEIKKMTCKKHNKRTYTFFCRSCNFLICTDCIFEIHSKNHNLAEISQFVSENFSNNTNTSEQDTKQKSLTDSGYEDQIFHQLESQGSSDDTFCMLMKDFEVVHTVSTNLPSINKINISNDDEAYVCSIDRNSIVKLKLNTTGFFNKKLKHSKSKQVEQTEGFQPIDITVNSNGDVLFLSRFDKCLKSVTKNSQGKRQVSDIRSFHPLEPICIHCEKDRNGKIWIGLTEGDSDFELTESSIRQVVAINQKGKLCNKLEFTKAQRKLFTLPWTVKNIKDKGICVIDRVSQTAGRVLSLDEEGHLMWIYTDLHSSFSEGPFNPSDLEITNSQNVIVADASNNAFHVLNNSGDLIFHQSSTHLGIQKPCSLNIDKTGHLWVGCLCEANSRDRVGKIYKIQIAGI